MHSDDILQKIQERFGSRVEAYLWLMYIKNKTKQNKKNLSKHKEKGIEVVIS